MTLPSSHRPPHLPGQAPLLSVDFGVDFWSFLLISSVLGQFWSKTTKLDLKSAPFEGVAPGAWRSGERGSVAGSLFTNLHVHLIMVMALGGLWRQIGESPGGSQATPSFSKVPGLPRKFPKLPRKFFGDFPGGSLTVELNSNPGVPWKFPRLPQKFPGLPQKFPELPRRSAPFSGKPDTLS